MFSIAVTAPGRLEVVDIPKPEIGPYDVLVKTELAYVCNSTDLKVIDGHFPGIDRFPILLGHETTGRVVEVGERAKSYATGDRAILAQLLDPPAPRYSLGWGGFSEFVKVRDHHAMVADGVADAEHGWLELFQRQIRIPKDIGAEDAAMLCTWLEVYSSFRDFRLSPGDEILIFGGGPVGLSFVRFARLLGVGHVVLVDSHAERRELALSMGADEVFERDDPRLDAPAAGRPAPLDAVIDAVGKESIINTALPLVKLGGTIGVYGVIDTPSITVRKHAGPYNFNLIVHQWPTAQLVEDAVEPVLKMVRDGGLSAKEFVTAELPVTEVAKAVELIRARQAIKVLLRF